MSLAEHLAKLEAEPLWAYVRSHGQNPRIHPNGFVQLDLEPVEEDWDRSKKRGHSGASTRLHVWNPPEMRLPRQETVNEVHDHVFDMHSIVFKGILVQQLYWFVIGSVQPNTHELYEAVYNQASDSRLQATGIRGTLVTCNKVTVAPKRSYTQPAFSFHDTGSLGTVVTLMTKTEIHEGDAHVVCPIDNPPDNDFKRDDAAPAEVLWDAIERSILS